ncbi:hypothetical protein [Sphingomonas sp. BK235]|uniref:hypothetical protein n=1 Tax=Sphingomonas sp. BK235 TaxID=2512131 RepID=UPI0010514614|nr:hypothetical protein [Sphingomonas sp. BK235]TCP32387.1 hypothetical protein EV292_10819 [Sphingomonas sp. BK235]
MFKPWPRLIKRIDGPRLWLFVDRSQPRPAIVIEDLSTARYRITVDYLARLSELIPVTPNRYEAKLLDQITDAMIDLAFLNKHGMPEEWFVDPAHWRK